MGLVFLALVFVAELAAWAAIGVAVHRLVGGGWLGVIAAVLAVVAATLAWGLFASPRATAPAAVATATKVATFGGACLLLGLSGRWTWAGLLAVLIVVAHVGVRVTGASAPTQA